MVWKCLFTPKFIIIVSCNHHFSWHDDMRNESEFQNEIIFSLLKICTLNLTQMLIPINLVIFIMCALFYESALHISHIILYTINNVYACLYFLNKKREKIIWKHGSKGVNPTSLDWESQGVEQAVWNLFWSSFHTCYFQSHFFFEKWIG